MRREPERLAATRHDLLVLGGGIQGAWIAWDAALRGLKVALIEQADFCGATSANSLTIVHGGLRYLQHADIPRMRVSIRERSTLLRVAPHLVRPLPCLIPTYAELMHGRPAMAAALALADLVGWDRNRPPRPGRNLPPSRTLGREACLDRIPGIDPEGVTGGALWHDAQLQNPARLVLAVLEAAWGAGAQVANRVQAVGLARQGGRVTGVEAVDRVSGSALEIPARIVVHAGGPWTRGFLKAAGEPVPTAAPPRLAGAMNLITRPLAEGHAFGVRAALPGASPADGPGAGARFLFVVPFRGCSLIGTDYWPYDGAPDAFGVGEARIGAFLEQVNRALPGAALNRADVRFWHGGLLPAAGGPEVPGAEPPLLQGFRLFEHRAHGGAEGLFSLATGKLTTARHVAQELVDRVCRRLGAGGRGGRTARTPVHGGDLADPERFVAEAAADPVLARVPAPAARALVRDHGTAWRAVPGCLGGGGSHPGEEDLVRAEVLHGIRDEMAHTLADVVLRRTRLGATGAPPPDRLALCLEVMAAELGWDRDRAGRERDAVAALFRPA
jgi:glycerol-3-phosphate dehydrogenase